MNITTRMRAKYKSQALNSKNIYRHPPGSRDVFQLCDIVDRLESIVRDLQHIQPAKVKNQIEAELFFLEERK